MKLFVRPEDAEKREIAPIAEAYSSDTRRLCACGRMFTPYRTFQRYCSDKCRVKYTKAKPSAYIKKSFEIRTCKECGKEFRTNDSKRHYCTRECYYEFQKKRRAEPETRVCMVCGEEFETTHWSKRYCSADCRAKARLGGHYE